MSKPFAMNLLYRGVKRFWNDERGVYAMIMALITIFLIATVAVVLETADMFTQKARLSDGLEQAALAVTTEDNQYRPHDSLTGSELQASNNNLVDSYVRSYIPNSQDLLFKTICYKNQNSATVGTISTTIACGVEGQFKQDSLFPLSIGSTGGSVPQAKAQDVIVPNQVTIGSSGYAQTTTDTTYYPQDLIVSINTSFFMDATWTGANSPGGDGSTLCDEGPSFVDRNTYIDDYRQHCVGRQVANMIYPGFSDLLPFSRMSYMDKILFAQTPNDWLPMVSSYSDHPSYNDYTGLIERFFDPSQQGEFNKFGRDRIRLMYSDFAYPDPHHYRTKCVFPFLLKPQHEPGFYDWFYSGPNYYTQDQIGKAYAIMPISPGQAGAFLGTNLSRFTEFPAACDKNGNCKSAVWGYGLGFTSILHQYLDADATVQSVSKFDGQPPLYPDTTFNHRSDLAADYAVNGFTAPPNNPSGGPELSLACMPNGNGPTRADSGWVNVSKGGEPNTQGLAKIKRVFAQARPGSLQFLPTALMEAAQRSLVGHGKDKGHRKVIILITGRKTQSLFYWSSCVYTPEGLQLNSVCNAIGPNVPLASEDQAYSDTGSAEYHWWHDSQNTPTLSMDGNGQSSQIPMRHIFQHYAYCKADQLSVDAYKKASLTQDPSTCEALGGQWVTYQGAVAVPNPIVSVLDAQDLSMLPAGSLSGESNGGVPFREKWDYVNAVFSKFQFDLLVKDHLCDKIRDHLKQVTGIEPLIAVIFISPKMPSTAPYWKECVGNHLYQVNSPSSFKSVMELLLQHKSESSSGALNINQDVFDQYKSNPSS